MDNFKIFYKLEKKILIKKKKKKNKINFLKLFLEISFYKFFPVKLFFFF